MSDPVDVVVVGGGVAGRSLARAMAVRGRPATLLEATEAASPARAATAGASALPLAVLNPWRGRKGAAHPDDLLGLASMWRWAEALRAEGRAPGAQRSGVLRLPTDRRQARAWRARAGAEAGPLAWLSPEAVPAPFCAPLGAIRVADGGWVDPAAWLEALSTSARARGATLRSGVRVARLARERPTDPWSLHDASGARIAVADRVVLCIGADDAPEVHDAGRAWTPPTLERLRGDIVTLRGGPALPLPLAGGVYGGSDGDVTYVGGGHRPPETTDPEATARLQAALARHVPGMDRAHAVDAWSGVRARTADLRPWVEELRPGLWWFGAFGGRGFLCAALEASRWADAHAAPATP